MQQPLLLQPVDQRDRVVNEDGGRLEDPPGLMRDP